MMVLGCVVYDECGVKDALVVEKGEEEEEDKDEEKLEDEGFFIMPSFVWREDFAS